MKKIIYSSLDIESRWNIVSDDGANNCCIKIAGYDKPMRGRSSMIVLSSQLGYVYFKHDRWDGEYHAPGGGWEPDETPLHAAIRECKEEAHIVPTDIRREGTRIEYYPDEIRSWVKEHVPDENDWWWGYYSAIFVGIKNYEDDSDIDPRDKDDYISSGKWYSIESVLNDPYLYPEYKAAIQSYLMEVK